MCTEFDGNDCFDMLICKECKAELESLKRATNALTKEVIERLWYKVKNMMGAELEWEWMAEANDGEYVERAKALRLIEKYLHR